MMRLNRDIGMSMRVRFLIPILSIYQFSHLLIDTPELTDGSLCSSALTTCEGNLPVRSIPYLLSFLVTSALRRVTRPNSLPSRLNSRPSHAISNEPHDASGR